MSSSTSHSTGGSAALRPYALAGLTVWTAIVAALLTVSWRQEIDDTEQGARVEARALCEGDLVFRSWATEQLHLFVPAPDNAAAAPDATSGPVVTTVDGHRLTEVSLSCMARDVHALGENRFGYKSHLTSLHPVGSGNAPDRWETAALEAFDRGEREVSAVDSIGGRPFMRLMRPVRTEESCLRCHVEQGRQAGTLRGGLSVSLPMGPWLAAAHRSFLRSAVGLGLLWGCGLLAGALAWHRLSSQLDARSAVEAALRESEFWIRESQRVGRLGSYVLDFSTGKWDGSEVLYEIFGIDATYERTVAAWGNLVHPEDREEMLRYFADLPVSRGVFDREYRIVRQVDGQERWVIGRGELAYDPAGAPLTMIGTIQDITTRRQADQTLRRSEERYRRLFNGISDAAFVHELAADGVPGTFTEVNDVACQRLGYTREELLRMGPRDIDAPEGWALVPSAMARLRNTGHAVWEGVHVHQDGHRIPVEISNHLFEIEGRPTILATIRDITERKRDEEEIRRRNRELMLLNRVVTVATADTEPRTVLETACRELALAFEAPIASAAMLDDDRRSALVVAEHLAPGVPPMLGQGVPVADDPVGRELTTGRRPLVVGDAGSDPRLVTVREQIKRRGIASLLALPLVIEESVVGWLTVSATVPRRFTQEDVELGWNVAGQVSGALTRARLSETRRRLMTAIEQTPESVMITDPEGRIVYVNPAFERITGYSRTEVIGQNPRVLKSSKHEAAFYRELWARIAAGEVWHGRLVNRRKDGTLFTEDAAIAPVRDESGAVASYIAVKRDITHELEVEEHFRQTQKMDSIGRLAGGVAHDFNNILTTIFGHGELALLELGTGHPTRHHLDEILKGAERAKGLTQQLLAFARRQPVEPRIVDLNELVESLGKMLRRLIGEHIELVTRPAPDLGRVRIDRGQMDQVLLNLAVNARDAMPEGGTLTVRTANLTIPEGDNRPFPGVPPGDYVTMTVGDTGTGMSDEVKGHVFEPFFTTKEQGKGTGLGLATCFGIVRQSNGHIRFDSFLGTGTTFTILLPRVSGDTAVEGGPVKAALPRGTETILLAEDEAALRRLMSGVLRTQGYTVIEAADGREALALAEAHGPGLHLVVSDVVMPGLGGHTLVERLWQSRPTLKVLLISGYIGDTTTRETPAGAHFLQKPFTPTDLARRVREILDAG